MHSESNSARKLLDGTVSDADRRRSLNGIIPHRAHGGGGGGGGLSPRRVTACGAAHKRLPASFQRTGPRRGLLYPPASIIVAATLQLAAAVPAGAPAGSSQPGGPCRWCPAPTRLRASSGAWAPAVPGLHDDDGLSSLQGSI